MATQEANRVQVKRPGPQIQEGTVPRSLPDRIKELIRAFRTRLASWIEPKRVFDPRFVISTSLALRAVTEIREAIGLDEDSYLRVAGQSHADARGYFLYTAIDEVQKACIYLMRLEEYVQGPGVTARAGHLDRTVLTQALEDSEARKRRLLELLVVLVLFSKTNEQPHYRHMLLLEELDGLLSANQDRKAFYGVPSMNVEDSIKDQVAWIREAESQLDLTRAWYRSDKLPLADSQKLRAGRVMSNHFARLRKALPVMTPGERLLVGFSYRAYSEASEAIHYTAARMDIFLPEDDDTLGGTFLGLLCLTVLDRCHDLLGRPELPTAKKIGEALARSAAAELVSRASLRHAAVGDFVLAAGDLAEVLEIHGSPYGLVSYRCRYLAERPLPDVPEDWFPTFHVQRLYTKEQYREGLAALLDKGIVSQKDFEALSRLKDAEVSEGLRSSVVHAWNAGLRDWVRSQQAGRSGAKGVSRTG